MNVLQMICIMCRMLADNSVKYIICTDVSFYEEKPSSAPLEQVVTVDRKKTTDKN